MKYLLIDGNNLAVRAAFSQDDLVNSQGIHVGCHYGTVTSLVYLKEQFPEHQFLLAWDGRSEHRLVMSREGVEKGIIPEAYKENRKKGETPAPLVHFHEQSDFLKHGIHTLGIPQIWLPDHEADDIIASYCEILKDAEEVVLVTSDKDYLQLLRDNIWIWDGMKAEKTTIDRFRDEWGISPEQWVDVGALGGDNSDNIFSPPGWGEKTAVEVIREHKTWEKVVEYYSKCYEKLRKKYPDFRDLGSDWNKEFQDIVVNALTKKGTTVPKEQRTSSCYVFPGVYYEMPWTGVAYAFQKGDIKMPKRHLMCLMYQERIELAYKLKAMKRDIPDLPQIPALELDKKRFGEYIDYYEMPTLHEKAGIFFEEKK